MRFAFSVITAAACLLSIGCSAEPSSVAPTSVPVSDSTAVVDPVAKQELAILAWNVESGGADPKVIAKQLSSYEGFDIFCLSEVHPNDFQTYEDSLGSHFDSLRSKSGNEDRLQIIYNSERFERLEEIELDRYRDHVLNNGNHRAPLALRLKDRLSDRSFIVMVNHLARGNAEFRKSQAIGLREWARDQDMAVINVGDFNMDYEFATRRGNEALDEMLRDNVWKWVEPKTWIDTNWDDRDGDGLDDFEGSLLDFAFVAGPAKTWNPACEVIVTWNDFPDDETTSDHRPISLRLDMTAY